MRHGLTLTTLPPGVNKDGAVVVIQPSTGNIPGHGVRTRPPTPTPSSAASYHADQLAYYSYAAVQKDHEGFFPLRPIATRETFAPGSTMKVVTSTATYNLKPSLAGFDFPVQTCVMFSGGLEDTPCATSRVPVGAP